MDNLKNIAPELSKLKKENNFTVPESYFEELPLKVQERVHQKKTNVFFGFSELIRKPAYVISFAILLILIVSIPLTVAVLNNQKTTNQIAYHAIELDELDFFDISEDLLIEAISANGDLLIEMVNEVEDDEMLDFILENVDYSTILDEL